MGRAGPSAVRAVKKPPLGHSASTERARTSNRLGRDIGKLFVLLVALGASAVGGCRGGPCDVPLKAEDYTRNDFPFMLSRISYVPRMDAHKLKLREGAKLLGELTTVRSHVGWAPDVNPKNVTAEDWSFTWLGFDHVEYAVYRSLDSALPYMDELRSVILDGVRRATFMSPGEFDGTDSFISPYTEAFGGYGPQHWSALCTLHFKVDGEDEWWETRVSVSLAVFFKLGEAVGDDVEVNYYVAVFSEESINTILVFPTDVSKRVLSLCAHIGLKYADANKHNDE